MRPREPTPDGPPASREGNGRAHRSSAGAWSAATDAEHLGPLFDEQDPVESRAQSRGDGWGSELEDLERGDSWDGSEGEAPVAAARRSRAVIQRGSQILRASGRLLRGAIASVAGGETPRASRLGLEGARRAGEGDLWSTEDEEEGIGDTRVIDTGRGDRTVRHPSGPLPALAVSAPASSLADSLKDDASASAEPGSGDSEGRELLQRRLARESSTRSPVGPYDRHRAGSRSEGNEAARAVRVRGSSTDSGVVASALRLPAPASMRQAPAFLGRDVDSGEKDRPVRGGPRFASLAGEGDGEGSGKGASERAEGWHPAHGTDAEQTLRLDDGSRQTPRRGGVVEAQNRFDDALGDGDGARRVAAGRNAADATGRAGAARRSLDATGSTASTRRPIARRPSLEPAKRGGAPPASSRSSFASLLPPKPLHLLSDPKDAIRNFSPSLFITSTTTSLVAGMFASCPYLGGWRLHVASALSWTSVGLFAIFSVWLGLRLCMHFAEFHTAASRRDPDLFFTSLISIALTLIVQGVASYSTPFLGPGATTASISLFWLAWVVAVLTMVFITFHMAQFSKGETAGILPLWMLTVLPGAAICAVGAEVARLAAADHVAAARHIIFAIAMTLGLVATQLLCLLSSLFQRLMLRGFPAHGIIMSMFFPLAPLALVGTALFTMGMALPQIFPQSGRIKTPAGPEPVSVIGTGTYLAGDVGALYAPNGVFGVAGTASPRGAEQGGGTGRANSAGDGTPRSGAAPFAPLPASPSAIVPIPSAVAGDALAGFVPLIVPAGGGAQRGGKSAGADADEGAGRAPVDARFAPTEAGRRLRGEDARSGDADDADRASGAGAPKREGSSPPLTHDGVVSPALAPGRVPSAAPPAPSPAATPTTAPSTTPPRPFSSSDAPLAPLYSLPLPLPNTLAHRVSFALFLGSPSVSAGLRLLGLAVFGPVLWWLPMALSAIVGSICLHGRLPYTPAWWGAVFPTGLVAAYAFRAAEATGIRAFDVVGCGLALVAVGAYCIVMAATAKHAYSGRLFVKHATVPPAQNDAQGGLPGTARGLGDMGPTRPASPAPPQSR